MRTEEATAGVIDTSLHPVVLFDGVCNLCNRSVQFIIDRDPAGLFHFASIQSPAGQEILALHGAEDQPLSSIVLVEGDVLYRRSTAALRIARRLAFPWPLLYVLIVFPSFVRDVAYNFVANNRYRWFGKTDECRMPAPEIRARFFD